MRCTTASCGFTVPIEQAASDERGDQAAPFRQFVQAFLAAAEDVAQHVALGIEAFKRVDIAIDRRFADDPRAVDLAILHVEVEARVKDVVPAVHFLEFLDGARVDLDAAVVASSVVCT